MNQKRSKYELKRIRIQDQLFRLGKKKEKFTVKEMNFLRRHVKTHNWCIHYGLYTKHSPQNKYVGFWIDYMSHNPRGIKPSFYGLKVIATRKMNQEEIDWCLMNYGCHNRRFHGWWVNSVNWVIEMDANYGIETPPEFIKVCQEKGYTAGLQQTLNFEQV